jgi:hypothetical protein
MIKLDELKEQEYYWYVFVPAPALNLQNVRLEKIRFATYKQNTGFIVVRNDADGDYLTTSISITPEDDEYSHIFPLDQRDEAELLWAREMFKNFEENNGIPFVDFVKLYKRIQVEKPEWII